MSGASKALNRTQSSVLEALRWHGAWSRSGAGAGWVWRHSNVTEKILIALAKKGYATIQLDGERTVYKPTEIGRPDRKESP